jgi:undecaprenyl-diphosphatase
MRVLWRLIAKLSQAETRLFASILMIAALLLAFGLLAEEVIEGETLPFDRKLMLALREAGNPGVPIGPPWLPEAARDISALGSTIVLGIILLAVVGYLLLSRRRAAAWLMLGAVLSGVALNNFLKFSFARPRPDLMAPAVQVFTAPGLRKRKTHR